jgi:ribose transport system substrate-binding protein
MSRIPASVFILISLCSLLSGCDSETKSASTENGPPTVALIMKSLANEFFVNMASGAKQHQADNSDSYELIVNGIKDESDLAQQVILAEQMIARGVDAIVIAPADSKALVPVLKRARQAGLIVVNIDNKLDAAILQQSGISIPFVGPDNREGARVVARHLATDLQAGDHVAIIGGISTAFNAQQRQLGFEDVMQDAGMNIVSVQSGEWQQAKASTIAAALIIEHPALKAILCSNDNMAIGAIAAIKRAGKSGEIQVVGFDNISASHDLLRSGSLLATADQYGSQLAIFGIEYALDILVNNRVTADKRTPVDLVTAASLASP